MSIELLQCRAGKGDYIAQYNLGLLYLKGQRVGQDYARAANLFHQAGRTNYADNDVVIQGTDGISPTRIFSTPNSQPTYGFAPAQYALGLMYLEGMGVEQNEKEARYWLKKAARYGSEEAKALLETLDE